MDDLRQRAIAIINRTIAAADMYRRGEISLGAVNAPIPEAEWYPSLAAVADSTIATASHYIQFAVDVGLLDRAADAELLCEFERKLRGE